METLDPNQIEDFFIFMEDYDEETDREFTSKVLKPYFKDIFKDLKLRVPS
jgi:hypothetical protein